MKESVEIVHLWFYHGAFALLCNVDRLITISMILDSRYTTLPHNPSCVGTRLNIGLPFEIRFAMLKV